jgi:two-component system sensor kinase FixL
VKARGKLAITLGFVLAILVAVGGFAYVNTRALEDAAAAIRAGHWAQRQLSDLLVASADAETAARAFVAAPTPAGHDAFTAARRNMEAGLADLRRTLSAEGEERRRVEALAPLFAQQGAWLDAYARAPGSEAANAAAIDPSGSRHGEIRAAITELMRDRDGALAASDAEWADRLARADVMLALGVAIGLGVFVPIFFRLYRESLETERAHEALRESEEHFRLLVESVRDYAIFPVDRSGSVMRWNRGAERIAGYASDEIVGRHVSRFYPPEEVAAGKPELDLETAAIDGVCESDGYRLRKDGSRFFANTIVSPLYDESRRVRGYSVAMRDVSERKRVEDALVESEARHRAVSELTSDYAYAFRVDMSGAVSVEWVAGAFTRITGYTGEEIEKLGGGIALVHPDDLGIALARIRNLVARKPDTSEFRIIAKSGDVRWIRESARPVWEENSGRLRVYGAAQDITDRKRAEDQAKRHQADLAHVLRVATVNEMAAGLAHEINQPLSAIVSYARGCSRRLRSGSGETEEIVRAIDEIAVQAKRADEIIRRLQSFIRKETPKRDEVEMNELVRDAVRLVSAEAAERRIAVQLDLAPTLPGLRADGIQVEQVILNLVRNAFDAMGSQPSERRVLTISTTVDGEDAIGVAVRDAGDGIRSECLHDVFSPFFTTKATGLGMGLAISRSIIEAHGGRIWATSEPGMGTTFHFTLPLEAV